MGTTGGSGPRFGDTGGSGGGVALCEAVVHAWGGRDLNMGTTEGGFGTSIWGHGRGVALCEVIV